jgi:hypothetical protein
VAGEARTVVAHCGVALSVTPLLGDTLIAQRAAVASAGALVVATPARVATALREAWLTPALLARSLRVPGCACARPFGFTLAHLLPALFVRSVFPVCAPSFSYPPAIPYTCGKILYPDQQQLVQ